jgi:hypothetical protein
VALALAFLMTNFQIKALTNYDATFFERKVATLALALGVDDHEEIGALWGGPNDVKTISLIAGKAYANHLSIFGTYPFSGVRETLGNKAFAPPLSPLATCEGSLSGIEITTDARFVRISGWIWNPTTVDQPAVVRLLDPGSREIGIAITGQPRPDLAVAIGSQASRAGYRGYILSDAAGASVMAQGEDLHGPLCQMKAVVPDLLFSIKSATPPWDEVTVDNNSILPGSEWTGADSFHTDLCEWGLRVYGSFDRGGDSDTGSITLRLRRGDRILYRSGPTGGRQVLEIPDHPSVMLPIALNWVTLDFSSPKLPKGQFLAKLTDKGSGWGEWSAIAVHTNESCR